MRYLADLHLHSHYAGATSPHLNLASRYQWAQIKGIDVVATGDFTHPLWLATLKAQLVADGHGFFKLRVPPQEGGLPGVKVAGRQIRFCLTTEVNCLYYDQGKLRKNHHLLYAPDFESVEKRNGKLARHGDLTAAPPLRFQRGTFWKCF